MPSRWSAKARGESAGGNVNSVRYHQAGLNGLSAGMGKSVKRSPMGYVVPGIARRFMPKYGSRYVPFSTSAPTTVFGTVTLYQPLGRYPGLERVSPFSATWAEDWIVQPARSGRRSSAPAAAGIARARKEAVRNGQVRSKRAFKRNAPTPAASVSRPTAAYPHPDVTKM